MRIRNLRPHHVSGIFRSLLARMGVDTPMRHVHIVGYPRSGTTLMNLTLTYLMEDAVGWDFEMWSLDPLVRRTARENPGKIVVTKHTNEFRIIERTRWILPGTHFVYMWRDPMGALASRRPSGDGYWGSPEDYIECYRVMKREEARPDVTVVRFADLVAHPDRVQRTLETRLHVRFRHPLCEAWKHIPEVRRPRVEKIEDFWTAEDERRLAGAPDGSMAERREEMVAVTQHLMAGSVRPLDPGVITKWRSNPEDVAYVEKMLAEHPELRDILSDYEREAPAAGA